LSVIIPPNFRMLYTTAQIERQVMRLGREISVWADQVWKNSSQDLLTIPVLRGGIFFFADLVRNVGHSVEIAPIRTWAYHNDQNVKRDEFRANMEGVDAKGRSVLLVDDICDSGRTLKKLSEAFLAAGATEVKSATLIKRLLKEPTFHPEWVGFDYDGPEWFVGYGMEDCDRWRNLADIYIIDQAK
jgi:hypoxanthine phosphoribosyltransferase